LQLNAIVCRIRARVQRARANAYIDRAAVLEESGDLAGAASLTLQAAKLEEARAQFAIGRMLEHGRGIQRDDAEAVKWFTRAS
jgi:TPR repeat protein